MDYLKLNKFNFKNKTVILRVDLNSTIINGRLETSERMIAHSDTIAELMNNGAKLVILAHQGRLGDKDYTELDKHCQLISELTGKTINYVNDLYGDKAKTAIKALLPGQAVMLKNVRSINEETAKVDAIEHHKTDFVKNLEPLADYFVLDAFSVAHRSQASVVGFMNIPNIAGKVMEAEIENVAKAAQNAEHPYVMILGGAKIDDYLSLIKYSVKTGNVFKILTCGVLGELCLMAKGIHLGEKEKFMKEKGLDTLLPEIKELMKKAPDLFEYPFDLAIEENNERKELMLNELPTNAITKDIGKKTANKYAEYIKQAKTIYL
ncbi:MAG: phosphoglycerate kinase, partial [Nanoarchaeota archaeon]|nr:phosphoglycerate kinase [Nanoarchaeota archaeon]